MELWIIYGILASLSFGSIVVLNKITLGKGMDPFLMLVLMALGILGVFAIAMLFTNPDLKANPTTIGLSLLAGILWGIGQLFVIFALLNNADVARLTPIFNTNTLVAVALGMILLKEVPAGDVRLKVIVGAILIVVGGILVSG